MNKGEIIVKVMEWINFGELDMKDLFDTSIFYAITGYFPQAPIGMVTDCVSDLKQIYFKSVEDYKASEN